MFGETVDDGQYPLLVYDGFVKLGDEVVVVMKDLTNSEGLWQPCEGTSGGRFGLYVEKGH